MYNVDFDPVNHAPSMHKIIPLRSCIWLYNLRFSSRTLWYPEAALDRVYKCFPVTTWRRRCYQTICLFLVGIILMNAKKRNCNLPSFVNSSEYCNFICSMPDLIEEIVPLNSFSKHKIVKESFSFDKRIVEERLMGMIVNQDEIKTG